MNSGSAFAEALQRHRRARGMTQAELAELARVSERAISDLERGLKSPQRATVRLLIQALGLPADQAREFESLARRPSPATSDAATGTPVHRDTNVPIHLRPLIGRARDAEGVRRALLADRSCLVTLVGPGGVGKTRLAVEVGHELRKAQTDGVWLVDLSAVTEADLVAPAVATSLGIRVELDAGPEATLLAYMAQRQLLLILDNCEHLAERCADLVWTIRQRCSSIRLLATSREPLGIEGEIVWRLRPLQMDDAAQLFAECARAQRADVVVEDTTAVLQLCRRLDGLPLAIELAAARVGVLSPNEMLTHLEDRFALLRRTSRGSAMRHQTLRATFDWSYDLLEPAEQKLFRRLAVFAGGFDLAAATAMGGQTALDVLGRLIDKSLVVAEPGPRGTRYRLLETLREYAWDRLKEAQDVASARDRHLAHFLGQAEELYSPVQGFGGPLRALDVDLDNLRTAFDWSEQTNAVAGLRLIAATGYVWWRRSSAEGRRWADLFLMRCPEPTLARAGALHAAGMLELFSDPARARHLEEQSYALAEQFGDQPTAAIARAGAGYAAVLQENTLSAIPELEHSLDLTEKVGDLRGIAWALIILAAALLTDHARREEGRQRVERALSMSAGTGDAGDLAGPSMGNFILGLYWRWSGAPERAMHNFQRALELQRGLELLPNLSSVLLQVARLLVSSQPARAATLAGASLAFAERAGIRFPSRFNRAADQLQEELRHQLGRARADRAWAKGGRLSTAEAITLALPARRGRQSSGPA